MAVDFSRFKHYLPWAMLTGGGAGMMMTDMPEMMHTPQGPGKPTLAAELLTAYREGARPVTEPAVGYGTHKFGGARLQEKTAGPLAWLSGGVKSLAAGLGTNPDKIMKYGIPAALGAAGLAAPLIHELASPTISAIGERLAKPYQPSQFELMRDEALQQFAREAGKGVGTAVIRGSGRAAMRGLNAIQGPTMVHDLLRSDPILSEANEEQARLIHDSYQTMQRVAPMLSREPFVAKNFLRDVLVTNNGPDHATLSSLAKSEQTIRGIQAPK